jgi:tetratricopeptide (TPR) repeat protein
MPSAPGERLPGLLLTISRKGETRVFRFAAGEHAFNIEFVNGEVNRVFPRPPDPKTFLGTMLVQRMGMDQRFIPKAEELRRDVGMLAGDAYVDLGAAPPKHIAQMLQTQAEMRFVVLLRAKRFLYAALKAPPAPAARQRLDWRPAMFNACWNSKSPEWIARFAQAYAKCSLEKVQDANPNRHGLGAQTHDIWRNTIQTGKTLEDYSRAKAVRAELLHRAIFTFWRVGVVRLVDENGVDLERVFGTAASEAAFAGGDSGEPVEGETLASPEQLEIATPATTPEPAKPPPPPPPPAAPAATPAAVSAESAAKTATSGAPPAEEADPAAMARRQFVQGMTCFGRNDWRTAAMHFQAADMLAPNTPDYMAYRAAAEFANDRTETKYEVTLAVLKKARERNPDSADLMFLNGLVYRWGGDRRRAAACFGSTLQKNPSHVQALREIRLFHMQLEKEKKTGQNMDDNPLNRLIKK